MWVCEIKCCSLAYVCGVWVGGGGVGCMGNLLRRAMSQACLRGTCLRERKGHMTRSGHSERTKDKEPCLSRMEIRLNSIKIGTFRENYRFESE